MTFSPMPTSFEEAKREILMWREKYKRTTAKPAQPLELSDDEVGDVYVKWDATDGASFADFARSILKAANKKAKAQKAHPLTDTKTLELVSAEYNDWIRYHAGGGDYDEFLRQRLGCTRCKEYRDATGELVMPSCVCKRERINGIAAANKKAGLK